LEIQYIIDPLSALSLAGNIVQLVEFAGDLVLKLKQFRSDYIAGVDFISKVKQTLPDLEDTRDPLLEFLSRLQKQQDWLKVAMINRSKIWTTAALMLARNCMTCCMYSPVLTKRDPSWKLKCWN
jgi:hypothetical protein